MITILEIRDAVIKFVGKYEFYVTPVCRFLLTLLAVLAINHRIGYDNTLSSPMLALIIGLIGALLPMSLTAVILGFYILLQLYSLALEAAAVGLVLFLVILLVYFRFAPKDALLLLLAPLCTSLGIPYVLPLIAGLVFGPASALTVAIAAVVPSFLRFVSDNETTIGQAAEDLEMIAKFRYLIDGIIQNRTMIVTAAAFVACVLVVYLVKRLRIPHAFSISVGVGALVQLLVLLIGDMNNEAHLSFGGVFVGVLFSVLIAEVIVFFLFNLDYSRTEDVQFEDDDYYYYVKAVPKVAMSAPERRVKTFGRPRSGGYEEYDDNGYDEYDDYYDPDALEPLDDFGMYDEG